MLLLFTVDVIVMVTVSTGDYDISGAALDYCVPDGLFVFRLFISRGSSERRWQPGGRGGGPILL